MYTDFAQFNETICLGKYGARNPQANLRQAVRPITGLQKYQERERERDTANGFKGVDILY